MTRFAISELIHFKGDKHHSHYFRGRLNNAVAGQGQRMKGLHTYFQDDQPGQLDYSSVGNLSEDCTNP
jgi:hypothetical protein